MKVIVMGAGIIGTASAWYLAKQGHEVTVIDRQPAAGLETSFANGAQISVSQSEPWPSSSTTPALSTLPIPCCRSRLTESLRAG